MSNDISARNALYVAVCLALVGGLHLGCGAQASSANRQPRRAPAASAGPRASSPQPASGASEDEVTPQSYCKWLQASKSVRSGFDSEADCVKQTVRTESRLGVKSERCFLGCGMKTDFGPEFSRCLRDCDPHGARSAIAYLAECGRLIKHINLSGDAVKAATAEFTASPKSGSDMARFAESIRSEARTFEPQQHIDETLKGLSARFRDMLEKLASAGLRIGGPKDVRAKALEDLDAIDGIETGIITELNEYCGFTE